MSEPFLGEIKVISWNFPPKGWSFCSGQLLPINQNQALFSILGTTYGGNGQTNFGLPDFRGRVPIHQGGGFIEGQKGGEEFHTLTQPEMPQHIHFLEGNPASATVADPGGAFLADINTKAYGAPSALIALSSASVSNFGSSQ